MDRKLTLRREALAELTDGDLVEVAGGATLTPCVTEMVNELLHTWRPTQCLCP